MSARRKLVLSHLVRFAFYIHVTYAAARDDHCEVTDCARLTSLAAVGLARRPIPFDATRFEPNA